MNEIYIFIIKEKKYIFPKNLITKGSYLYTRINTSIGSSNSPKKDKYLLDDKYVTKEIFDILYDYVLFNRFPHKEDFDILDYFMVNHREKYESKIKINLKSFEEDYIILLLGKNVNMIEVSIILPEMIK